MAEKKLNIKVRTKGAKKSKKDLKGVEGGMKSLGKAAAIAGSAFFAAKGLITGFKKVIELAGAQELAEKKLEASLGKVSQALLDQASALQQVSMFGDEAIIEAQALIAAFVDDEEAIKKATKATLDLAAAKGMDLTAAADLVSKTLGSSTNAMSRYGIEVIGAVGSTERLNTLTGNIADKFGGQASAQADTYAGSVKNMKDSLGDMAEQIGAILIPVFEKLEPHLSLAIDFWSKYFGSLKDGEGVSKPHSEKIAEMTSLISFQHDRLKGLTAANISQHGVSEKGLQLIVRANDQSRTAVDQLKFEKEELGKLITEKFNLIKLEERLVEVRAIIAEQAPGILALKRAELDMTIEAVEVTDPAANANKKYAASIDEISSAAVTALKETSGLLAATSGASKRQQIQAMRLAQFAAIADTAAGVMKAFKQGGTFGFLTGAGIAATGAAQIATIQQAISNAQGAETGFDGIVNQPTMFMTGEGNKAERVSVTPLQGPNINGPQGGITLNISAPLVDEHILDVIIPAIQKAQRMNLA